MKTCFKCKVAKPIDEFYRHPMMADGRLNKCKECTKLDVRLHREANIDRVRAYDRSRGARQTKEYASRYHVNDPRRRSACSKLRRAIKNGTVKRSEACWYCGSTIFVVGHHADYDNPLGVTWLCQACHRRVHLETEQYKQRERAP